MCKNLYYSNMIIKILIEEYAENYELKRYIDINFQNIKWYVKNDWKLKNFQSGLLQY